LKGGKPLKEGSQRRRHSGTHARARDVGRVALFCWRVIPNRSWKAGAHGTSGVVKKKSWQLKRCPRGERTKLRLPRCGGEAEGKKGEKCVNFRRGEGT